MRIAQALIGSPWAILRPTGRSTKRDIDWGSASAQLRTRIRDRLGRCDDATLQDLTQEALIHLVREVRHNGARSLTGLIVVIARSTAVNADPAAQAAAGAVRRLGGAGRDDREPSRARALRGFRGMGANLVSSPRVLPSPACAVSRARGRLRGEGRLESGRGVGRSESRCRTTTVVALHAGLPRRAAPRSGSIRGVAERRWLIRFIPDPHHWFRIRLDVHAFGLLDEHEAARFEDTREPASGAARP